MTDVLIDWIQRMRKKRGMAGETGAVIWDLIPGGLERQSFWIRAIPKLQSMSN